MRQTPVLSIALERKRSSKLGSRGTLDLRRGVRDHRSRFRGLWLCLGAERHRPVLHGLGKVKESAINKLLRFAWGVLAAWAALAGVMTMAGLAAAKSASQKAAIGAISCAPAIVPYVLLRALDEASGRRSRALG